MERIIVEVFLPAAGREFDVRIPLDLNAGETARMIARALSDLSEGSYLPSKSSCRETGMLLDHAKTMRQCGVKNTSRLMMI